ncbi:hypothetical protein [Pseudomaricurvus sp. HS19]|uniref:hypothetical protein n=1 Tax=Pseudomaricurvus sp. HS19 TaxID=2692626 RepID=UPI0013708BBF|nr:hypothetical protein [Pseudomaricurvus sp. HS19]MYM61944.1 hypothetical protein [Pseudomaricurvus sp. HS19]
MKNAVLWFLMCVALPAVALELQEVTVGGNPQLQPPPESFSDYRAFVVDTEQSMFVYLAPALADKASAVATGWSGLYAIRLEIGGKVYLLHYDEGASDDPTFIVESPSWGQEVYLYGEKLFVSAGGNFYLTTRNGNAYNVRQKYSLTDSGLKEVPQSFYLVDMTCPTTGFTQLYQSPCGGGKKVAAVPAGSEVRVLLQDPNSACDQPQYLVKTSFGLLGWVGSSAGHLNYSEGQPLGCLRTFGD